MTSPFVKVRKMTAVCSDLVFMVLCGLFLVRVSLCNVARAVWHPAQWLKAVVSAAGIVITKGLLR